MGRSPKITILNILENEINWVVRGQVSIMLVMIKF